MATITQGFAAAGPAPNNREWQTVEHFDAALALAKRLGYRVRLDDLGGDGGGGCEISGQKWLFIDLSLTPREQLEQALTALRHEASILAQRCVATQAEQGRPTFASDPAESIETISLLEVASSKSESGERILPRWRRWYRMIFGCRRTG